MLQRLEKWPCAKASWQLYMISRDMGNRISYAGSGGAAAAGAARPKSQGARLHMHAVFIVHFIDSQSHIYEKEHIRRCLRNRNVAHIALSRNVKISITGAAGGP